MFLEPIPHHRENFMKIKTYLKKKANLHILPTKEGIIGKRQNFEMLVGSGPTT